LKYAFINRHRRLWPIWVQCRVLGASVARYHEHFVRAASTAQRRHLSNDALLVHIRAIDAWLLADPPTLHREGRIFGRSSKHRRSHAL